MSWELNSTQPIYLQVADKIGQRIISGEYPPGGKLPPVRELAEEAGVNPNTMQRAMTELENEGLVYAQRTSGRFVTDDTAKIGAVSEKMARHLASRFLADMRSLGFGPDRIAQVLADAVRDEKVTRTEALPQNRRNASDTPPEGAGPMQQEEKRRKNI